MGDPAGVGPEVCLKAILHSKVRKSCIPIIIGDLKVLKFHAQKMRIHNSLRVITSSEIPQIQDKELNYTPVIDLKNVKVNQNMFGKIRSSFGQASAKYIEVGIEFLTTLMMPPTAFAP